MVRCPECDRAVRAEDDSEPEKKSLLPWILAGGLCGAALIAVVVVVLIVVLSAPEQIDNPFAPGQPAAANPAPPEVPAGPVPAQIDRDAVSKVKQATVYLRVQLPNGGIAQGSGFFCGQAGVVVTNAHVLGMLRADSSLPQNVEVVAHSGEPDETKMTAAVLGVDRTNDLAVLSVTGDATRLPPPLPVISAAGLFETQKVYIFGFPKGAALGKELTVSESSVSALRRDDAGMLNRVQVNGGMHPGNSGGPVTDARGVVIGVSVSGYLGTQLNFAIPGDSVMQVLDGRIAGHDAGLAFQADNQVKLPVRIECLDPLRQVREVKVEVWAGAPGVPRLWTGQEPQPLPGDGARSVVAATFRDGAYAADIPVPPLNGNGVCWVQPLLVNAAGAKRWGTARPVAATALAVIDRRPALLQFKPPTSPSQRTVRMKSTQTVSLYERAEMRVFGGKMDAGLLESLGPDPRGIGTFIRLTLGQCPYSQELAGKTLVPPPQAYTNLSRFSPTFLVDAGNACTERGKRNFNIVAPMYRKLVESMYELICNSYESTTLPLPNRMVQPLETWPARMPMFVLVNGKRQLQDIYVTCTYQGVRTVPGRTESVISLSGEVRGRGPHAALVLGKAKGRAHVDIDKGFLTSVELSISSELEIEDSGVRVMVNDETILNRSEGNTLGIVAVTPVTPAPALKPPALVPPKTPPAASSLPGLVAYWSFDDADVNAKVADLSGKGHDGKAVGAGQVEGIRGKALALTGINSYFDFSAFPALNHKTGAPFTIAFWVKTRSPSATIVSQRNSTNDGTDLDFTIEKGRLTVTARQDRGLIPAKMSTPFAVNDDRWHHCALTRNGNAIELFLDGSSQGTANATGLEGPITTDWRFVGRENYWRQQGKQAFLGVRSFLEGAVDELCIFERTLTREQIGLLAGR